MSGELLVILIVACVVFGPNKLPLLARHLGLCVRYMHQLREQWGRLYTEQMNAVQLLQNQEKAREADNVYREQEATGLLPP
jgi:sec-independent protein translocase protein TatB